MSMNRQKRKVFLRFGLMILPVGLFALLCLLRWFHDPRISNVERLARQHAGWSAWGSVPCGNFNSWSNRRQVRQSIRNAAAKATTAYKQNNPFVIRFSFDTMEGQQDCVLMGTRSGKIFELRQEIYDYGSIRGRKPVGPFWIVDQSKMQQGNLESNLTSFFFVQFPE